MVTLAIRYNGSDVILKNLKKHPVYNSSLDI